MNIKQLSDIELRKIIVDKYGGGEDFGEYYLHSPTRSISDILQVGDPYCEEFMRRVIEEPKSN